MLIPTPYDDFERLFSGAGFDVSKKNYLDFAQYAALLVDWNEKINLTAITGAAAITEKHFLDSVYPLKLVEIPENSVVVDVGTGAGFPGIPLKIMRPDLKLVLVDSLNKRVNFLQKVIGSLELRASKALHLRAENGGKLPILREQADVATARAVASLPTLCEYCLPYVKVGGFFMALKGPNEDVEEAFPAISELGGKLRSVEKYTLPCGDERTLVIIDKVAKTPDKYPRKSGAISKKTIVNGGILAHFSHKIREIGEKLNI